MSLQVPVLSGVSPTVNDTDVELRPTIEIAIGGQSLVDPLTWGSATFALYGPGDVVLEAGPGTILNSGLDDAPYPLLDGPLRRDRCEGEYSLVISGTSGLQTAESAIGTSGQIVLARFLPNQPLLPNTEYTAVLIGDDSSSLFQVGNRRFDGLTSYTSPSGFILSGVAAGTVSGFISVAHPYSKTLQTGSYVAATGQNDTYTITIVSGHGNANSIEKGFKYQWSQASSPGTYSATVSGTSDRHNLGDGLQIDFEGTMISGEVYQLNTYIPKPLANSQVWKFSTGTVSSYGTPPSDPGSISIVIDDTATGGFGVDTTTSTSGAQFYVINSDPVNLEYDVSTGLSYIQLQFNKEIASGNYDVSNVELTCTPLLGIPAPIAASGITPSRLETSGAFLKIFLT